MTVNIYVCKLRQLQAVHRLDLVRGLQLTANRLISCRTSVPMGTLGPVPPASANWQYLRFQSRTFAGALRAAFFEYLFEHSTLLSVAMARNSTNTQLQKCLVAGSTALIIFSLTSCSAVGLDPKAPSEGNFKKAIDQYLATNKDGKDCFNLNGTLPYDLPRRQDDPALKALEGAGLLHSSDVMAVTGNHLPGYNPGPEPVKRFEATEAGRKFFSPAESHASLLGEHPCRHSREMVQPPGRRQHGCQLDLSSDRCARLGETPRGHDRNSDD